MRYRLMTAYERILQLAMAEKTRFYSGLNMLMLYRLLSMQVIRMGNELTSTYSGIKVHEWPNGINLLVLMDHRLPEFEITIGALRIRYVGGYSGKEHVLLTIEEASNGARTHVILEHDGNRFRVVATPENGPQLEPGIDYFDLGSCYVDEHMISCLLRRLLLQVARSISS